MKLQCSCGAKYSFDVTPDMAGGPVHFSCPACGMDYSEFVTNLVRQELGSASTPARAIAPPPPGYVPPPPVNGGASAVPSVAGIASNSPAIAPAPAVAGPGPAPAPVLAPI